MKDFLKYLGSILILIGVVILSLYYFGVSNSNVLLVAAGIIMVVGFTTHIVVNRRID